MSRSRWRVTAGAMVLGVALASPALAADPKPTQLPVVKPEQIAPKVTQIEVPGLPAYNGSVATFNLVKGQSYTVKVKYSTPPPLPLTSQHPSPYPHGAIVVASTGVVLVKGGAYTGADYEFTRTYCLSIPKVRPGSSTVLETPVFLVPANLTGNQFLITAKQPAQSCR